MFHQRLIIIALIIYSVIFQKIPVLRSINIYSVRKFDFPVCFLLGFSFSFMGRHPFGVISNGIDIQHGQQQLQNGKRPTLHHRLIISPINSSSWPSTAFCFFLSSRTIRDSQTSLAAVIMTRKPSRCYFFLFFFLFKYWVFPFLIFLFQIITAEVGAFKSQLYPIIYSAVGDQRKKKWNMVSFRFDVLEWPSNPLSLSLSLYFCVCVCVCVGVLTCVLSDPLSLVAANLRLRRSVMSTLEERNPKKKHRKMARF